jgi:hypothetical protein
VRHAPAEHQPVAHAHDEIAERLRGGMPEQAPQHLFAAQRGVASVGSGDVADHLALDFPDRDQLRQQRQPAQRAGRQCQRTGGERGALCGTIAQRRASASGSLLLSTLLFGHLTDEIEDRLRHPVVFDRCDDGGDFWLLLVMHGSRATDLSAYAMNAWADRGYATPV